MYNQSPLSPLSMKIEQKEWIKSAGWIDISENRVNSDAQLVLAFGAKGLLKDQERFKEIRAFYPNAEIVINSTAGEILGAKISVESINTTAIQFDSTTIFSECIQITSPDESYDAGTRLIEMLKKDNLVYALVISDGSVVNGTELTSALGKETPNNLIITGGLAGDGPNFQSTLVGLNAAPSEGNIVAVGFYGDKLKVGHAARGGWDPFGPDRVVTKSKNNVLYELDGQSALDLYKKYLGDLAEELPGSALLFPLGLKVENSETRLVRTVLGVNEDDKSMTFAGDLPEGSVVRMMRSNFDRLVDSAGVAADTSVSDFGSFDPELAIIISCAGRKFVLQERIEEEIVKVQEILGDNTVVSGFYAYGEISPIVKSTKCELHNQTMTITTFKEVG